MRALIWFRSDLRVADNPALHFNEEYQVNEQRRDAAVRAAFRSEGLACESVHDQTVVPPALLRTRAGGFFTVFTPFRRAWLAHLEREGVPRPLPPPAAQPPSLVAAELRHQLGYPPPIVDYATARRLALTAFRLARGGSN